MKPLRKKCAGGLGVVVPLVMMVAVPETAVGQDCSLDVRFGHGLAIGEHVIATGNPTNDLDSGRVLGVGGSCQWTRWLRPGLEVEGVVGGFLDQWHFGVSTSTTILESDPTFPGFSLEARALGGWTRTSLSAGNYLLIGTPTNTIVIEPGTSGPMVGISARASALLTSRVDLFLDVGWRCSFLEETIFDGPFDRRTQGLVLHGVPISGGVRWHP